MVHKITDLKSQKRNRKRVNIYLDGAFAFGLSRIVAAWLNIGQELTEEKIAELIAEDEQEVAYQRALKFLTYRTRSSAEVKQSLRKNGISDSVNRDTLERLEKNGLVDDLQFAESWVENRNEFRPRSHRMLAIELMKKGIDQEIISQVLETNIPDEELAYKAAEKKLRKFENLEWEDFRRKLSSYLARRGFSYATTSAVVLKVWEELITENPVAQ
jgi:regulatory protein